MVRISFVVFLWVCGWGYAAGQRLHDPGRILFSGVVLQADEGKPLPHVTCRYGEGRAALSDEEGRFRFAAGRGDTVLFTFVGMKACRVVIPDTLSGQEYMVGVFMYPDTILLSEALIVRRFVDNRGMLGYARSNMERILMQAFTPVEEMDAGKNQQMMIEDFARSTRMKGMVDVRFSIGTQSWDIYRLMRLGKQSRARESKQELDDLEVDLLKKLYCLKKKQNPDN